MIAPTQPEAAGRAGMVLRGLGAVCLVYALVFAHRSFPTAVALIGLSGVPSIFQLRLPRWGWAILGLAAWAACTVLWSPYPDAGSWIPYLGALVLAAIGLAGAGGERSLRWIVWASVVALILLTVEAISGGILRDLTPPDNRPDKDDISSARGISIALFLVPAVFLVAYRARGIQAALILLPVSVMAMSFGVSVNLLGLVAGACAAAAAWIWPRLALRAAFGAAMAGFVVMPLVAAALPPIDTMMEWTAGPASWRMRLMIWKDVWAGVSADGAIPVLFGHGVESARVLGEELGPRLVPGATMPSNAIPTHPHNIFLQVWYDLGVVGVGICIAALGLGARAAERLSAARDWNAMGVALMAVTTTFAAIDASLWTTWRVVAPIFGGWMLWQASRMPRVW